MDYSKEIEKVMLECKNKGINSREVLQLMEVPCEWTGDSYLFDFGSMPVEELSDYIDYIFRNRWYVLDKGTPVDGFYSTSKMVSGLDPNNYMSIYCRYKVEIYSSGGKTYLEMFMPYEGFSRIDKILFGEKYREKYLNVKITELDQIADQIKFLKPSIKGYLVCNKCGAYYEVLEEDPENVLFQLNLDDWEYYLSHSDDEVTDEKIIFTNEMPIDTLELIMLDSIKRKNPKSVERLAAIVQEDVKEVHSKLEKLVELGFIILDKGDGNTIIPALRYDKITIKI